MIAPTAPTASRRIAWIALGLLLGLTTANLLFNLIATGAGWPLPYRSFLPPAGDRFADFFKLAFSYPGGSQIPVSDMLGLGDILREHQADRLTRTGIDALRTGAPNHFHLTPLSTLIALVNTRLMHIVDPALLFAAWMGGLALWWAGRARAVANDRTEAVLWTLFGLVSYPMLFMVERGNIFAAIVGLALVHALLLAIAGRGPVFAGLLLALAINIRPNALLLAAPMGLFLWQWRYRFTATVVIGAAAIAAVAMGAAHALYPDYGPATFLAGLRTYLDFYVHSGRGLAYNSALYGALALLVGPDPLLDRLALLASLALLAVGLLLYLLRRIDRPVLVFIACASYALASTIFADYHLIVFLVLPLALALAPAGSHRMPARSHLVVLLASVAVLAPKHYVFGGQPIGESWVSAQSILNPLLLLTAILLLFAQALAPRTGGR